MQEPLTSASARDLARKILAEQAESGVRYLQHVMDRCALRGITIVECIEAIRSYEVVDVRMEKGTWRYRFEGGRIAVAILFQDEHTMWLVTAYRPGEFE